MPMHVRVMARTIDDDAKHARNGNCVKHDGNDDYGTPITLIAAIMMLKAQWCLNPGRSKGAEGSSDASGGGGGGGDDGDDDDDDGDGDVGDGDDDSDGADGADDDNDGDDDGDGGGDGDGAGDGDDGDDDGDDDGHESDDDGDNDDDDGHCSTVRGFERVALDVVELSVQHGLRKRRTDNEADRTAIRHAHLVLHSLTHMLGQRCISLKRESK
eukprot:2610461-Pleurochrysis_carterae.AAC.1